MCIQDYTGIRTHISIYTCSLIVFSYVCAYVHIYTYSFTRSCLFIDVLMYISYIYMYICTYMYVYIYTPIHILACYVLIYLFIC